MISHEATGLVRPNGKLVAVVGLEDVVVIDTDDAILVTSLSHAQDVKRIVECLKDQGREGLT